MAEGKTLEELIGMLCLEPGFTLVPQDRFEELVRAEAERDVLEAVLSSDKSYNANDVMKSIRNARRRGCPKQPEVAGDAQ
ncbi:hypothetical protein [Intestinimonas butyriciproducens]|uniref:hypothetical protein n=1 Tax=Intestinimonas butyriciproducens TaxID=1297617 RepID=UPI00195BF7B9|nr:hypothetical protein [Intestinimonas butyriciproducens]MBM6974697.1 hypothetical protein [Intestinimonas butyriciproducens]